MLRFLRYIKEMATGDQGAAANAKGVAFETALTRGLHHKGVFAESHPDENGMNAEEAHNHHMKVLTKEGQDEVHNSIKPSVEALRAHLEKHHGISKHDDLGVHWTSKPGQLAKTTGNAEDKDNPGDLALHHKKSGKHISVSLKFGAKPGLRSPGLKDLHKLANIESDDKAKDDHYKEIEHIGKNNGIHGKTASLRNKAFRAAEKDPSKSESVKEINKKSLEHRSHVASRLAAGFNNLNHEEHKNVVRRLMNAEQTNTPTVKLHYDTKKKSVHISDPVGEMDNIHKNTKKFHFEHKGMYVHVHAIDHDGKSHHIGVLGIKNNSSPFTHTVGNMSKGKNYDKFANRGHD